MNSRNVLQKVAASAHQHGGLVRTEYRGGPIGAIDVRWAPTTAAIGESRAIARVSARAWKSAGGGRFDGELIGVVQMRRAAGSLRLSCAPMRYRNFLAAERLLRHLPRARIPLAIGIHALIVAGGDAVALVLDDGRLSVPGGAVDLDDMRRVRRRSAAPRVLARAILREVREETGLDLAASTIVVTGVYVGATPPHVAVMTLIECADLSLAFRQRPPNWRVDPRERIHGVRLVRLTDLAANPARLSLAARTAVGSMLDWGGRIAAGHVGVRCPGDEGAARPVPSSPRGTLKTAL